MGRVWLPAVVLASVPACGDAGAGGGLAQHEVTVAGDLLTADGRLREPGWSSRQLQRWNPEAVADPSRLRRWDFFSALSPAAAVNVTLSDLGFLQFATVGVVDRATGVAHTGGTLEMNTGQLALSPAFVGDATFTPANAAAPGLTMSTTDDGTAIVFDLPGSILGAATHGQLTLHRRPTLPYLSLATPFAGDPHDFFFEQKVHGMTAEGTVTIGDDTWTFDAADTIATADWGRGQWPAQVTWQWAGAAGTADDGRPIALNLGAGFGDDRAGTENLLVLDDVAIKLGRVGWSYDPDDPLADWRFESIDPGDSGDGRDGDGAARVSLVLHADTPERNDLDLGERFSHLRKAYGRYTGTITLAGGQLLNVTDLPGFAEDMHLSW
ncbi:MAG TPA: DUF2804 domain-containing protein [Kofleriaceae bacterium]|nr:DUF2804 domain-containing protein [Kofleriaceae bacterium]